jgi:hypothetical protein
MTTLLNEVSHQLFNAMQAVMKLSVLDRLGLWA